jgi:hypothetical protein
LAGQRGHLEVVSYLLHHGADVNMKNNVSTAISWLAVMVEMVGCGGEGWDCGGSDVSLCNVNTQ